MEIDDREYVDELIRGMESKVGATIPECLSQPILAGWSSSYTGENGSSTPMKPGERQSGGEPDSGDEGPSKRELDAAGLISAFQNVSPIKRFTAKRQQMEDNCRKLRSDMNALRAMDVSLMKHFLAIYDAVEELRWMMESYDMSDSCESLALSSSVYESMEQIHEKWMTERRQWQSTSSRDLSTSWREDSRFNLHHVGRLNSTGSRRQDGRHQKYHGLSLQNISWRSPQQDMNQSFPQFSSGTSNFEMQRRSSVDHIPTLTTAQESPETSPMETRKRRSSSGGLELEVGVVEVNAEEGDQEKAAAADSKTAPVKKKFLFHSRSSPSFDTQLQWVEVTDTAII
ncbi:uncharacterized protein LOC119722535 [Patiria miniata]|uniref:Uncharacterized protein n=1 Tax=Patiria miniata TaxID=46514 RepID=A0A913ZA42_PATMI|nr:uncharacterized protein LOC119722535 [Patiria miniata]